MKKQMHSSQTEVPNRDLSENSVEKEESEDCEGEDSEEREDTVKLTKPIQFTASNSSRRQPRQHPGIILLGRGNSFSLGCSEVILLHSSRRARTGGSHKSRILPSPNNHQNTTVPVRDSLVNSQANAAVGSQPEPAPPVISNESPDLLFQNVSHRQGTNGHFEDELEIMWRKAESIMFSKQGSVQQILEDFGIKEPGEAGGRGEPDEEEENVWRIMQDNFRI